jgi:hypothetical protein
LNMDDDLSAEPKFFGAEKLENCTPYVQSTKSNIYKITFENPLDVVEYLGRDTPIKHVWRFKQSILSELL